MVPAVPRRRDVPVRSDLRDVRRLLRGLDDLAALRRNPLVAHLFSAGDDAARDAAVVARVRRCVEDAAKRLSGENGGAALRAQRRRQCAILVRYDLRRERWLEVAADLGVCRRQFLRDRRAACQFVRDRLAYEFPPARGNVRVDERDALALDVATRLGNLGQFARALEVYEELAAASNDGRSIPVLARHAVLSSETSRFADARRSREQLRRLVEAAPTPEAEIEAAWADSMYCGMTRDQAGAESACRRLLAYAQRAPHGTRRIAELEVEAHVLLAELLWERRATRASRVELSRAARVLERVDGEVPQAAASYAQVDFLLHYVESDLPTCAAAVARAQARLRAAGQLRQLVKIEGVYGLLQHRLRNAAAALAHAACATALARSVSPLVDLAYQLGRTALIDATYGDVAAAACASRDATELAGDDPRVAGMTSLVAAEIALRERRHMQAGRSATAAARRFEEAGFWIGAGWSWETGARAAARGGDVRVARRWIGSAMKYFERCGTRVDVARSFSASAEITGNREHGAYASSLMRALRG